MASVFKMGGVEGQGVISPPTKEQQVQDSSAIQPVAQGKRRKRLEVPPSRADDEKPDQVSPDDWLAWRCISDVLNWMVENRSRNVTKACKETGWPRHRFYRSRDNRFVQAELHRQLINDIELEQYQISAQWFEVIDRQLDTACSKDDPRAATAAAKFLAQRRDLAMRELERNDDDVRDVRSRAKRNMDMLLGMATGGRQKVTVERIERVSVGSDEDGMGGDIVDGEVVVRDMAQLRG